jgi:hypothetical protein
MRVSRDSEVSRMYHTRQQGTSKNPLAPPAYR